MDVQTDRESDAVAAVTIISALLLVNKVLF